MARKVRILGVHGLGHQKLDWLDEWSRLIRTIYDGADELELEFAACFYDSIFENTSLNAGELIGAAAKLGWSGITHLFRRERGFFSEVEQTVQWTAGYVVAWVEDKNFQSQTRKLFLDQVRHFQPDIILAHSLGSLVTYNAIPMMTQGRALPRRCSRKFTT